MITVNNGQNVSKQKYRHQIGVISRNYRDRRMRKEQGASIVKDYKKVIVVKE